MTMEESSAVPVEADLLPQLREGRAGGVVVDLIFENQNVGLEAPELDAGRGDAL